MDKTYSINIGGLKRELPLCEVAPDFYIAALIMFGDVELTVKCAEELLKKAPEFDVIITPEAKSIPIAYEMARLSGHYRYIVARKGIKVYMRDVIAKEVMSITTQRKQTLYFDGNDGEFMKGKRILIVDDVISTGESLAAMEALVKAVGGDIVGKMAVLAEGEAAMREDIIFLDKLPLFNGKGEIIL